MIQWALMTLFLTGCTGTVSDHPAGPRPPGSMEPPPILPEGSAGNGLPCNVDTAAHTYCQRCHTATPRYGAPMPLMTWVDFHTAAISNPSLAVYEVAAHRIANEADPMPPAGAERLDDAGQSALDAWFAAGAPAASREEACAEPPPLETPVEGPEGLPCTPTHVLRAHAAGSAEPFHVTEDADNLYQCFTFRSPFAEGTQATAWAPLIGDERVVHHWILYRTPEQLEDQGLQSCSGMALDSEFVIGWAPGGGNQVLPPDVGAELPGPDESLLLQIHYWNGGDYPDAYDDSGVALCTTEEPRANEAGVLWLGAFTILIPPRATDYVVTGTCSALSTSGFAGPLNVLWSGPHMHQLGTALSTEISRGGNRQMLVNADPFSFDAQASIWHSPPVVIQPGDTVTTRCTYTNPGNGFVTFGERTEDEMCFNFAMVYPISAVGNRKCLF